MLITKFVEVKMGGHSIKHYKALGYDVKHNSIIKIPIEHLTDGSHVLVEIECDYCGEHIFKKYQDYLKSRINTNKDCCNKSECKVAKQQETCLKIYGVEIYAKTDECQEKYKKTCLEKYGVDNYSKTKEFKDFMKNQWENMIEEERKIIIDKRMQANLDIYGVEWYFVTEEFKDKSKQTCLEKYDVDMYCMTEDFKDKRKQTWLEKYNVEYPQQCPEIRLKSMESYFKNGTISTSQQQLELFKLIQILFRNDVYLNYPFDYYLLDIAIILDKLKIDIEYDGWYWHKDRQHFDKSRNSYLIKCGWKVLRIKSGYKLPTFDQLKESINILINTNQTYQEIILDDWKENDSGIAI